MYCCISDRSPTKEKFSGLIDHYFDPHLCQNLPVSEVLVIKEIEKEMVERHNH